MFSDNVNLKKLQETEVETLKAFDEVCRKNHLTYFACGGTLIGTVREKGFVPWDDDMDIMMPRKDYERLIKHRTSILPDNLFINDYRIKEERVIPRPIPALFNTNVSLYENDCKASVKEYAFIDIFVLDGMPNKKLARRIHYYHVFFWHTILQLSWFDEFVSQHRSDRSNAGKIAIWLLNHFNPFRKMDSRKLYTKKNKISMKYDWNASDYVFSPFGPHREKEVLKKRWFTDIVRMKFENIEINVPNGFDEELRSYYGDYMTPPEHKEDRELHHYIQVILNDEKAE